MSRTNINTDVEEEFADVEAKFNKIKQLFDDVSDEDIDSLQIGTKKEDSFSFIKKEDEILIYFKAWQKSVDCFVKKYILQQANCSIDEISSIKIFVNNNLTLKEKFIRIKKMLDLFVIYNNKLKKYLVIKEKENNERMKFISSYIKASNFAL